MDPLEAADNAVVECQNSEKGDTCCQDSSQRVGKVPADVLAILANQNASTLVVAPAIPCQDAPWTLPNIPLVHFHPSPPCWKLVRGDLGKIKRQGLESNQQPMAIYAGALNH